MRKKRVLVLTHIDLVPPDDIAGKPDAEVFEYKTEYEVISGLRELGHEVQPLGLYDDLSPLRQAIQDFKPHIVFNLLDEFRGEAMLDQNVVSFLELVQVPYTGCNPRGLMLARDKALSKKILHYHRIRVPRFAVVPAGRKLKRKPARLEYPLIVKSQIEEASFGIAEASLVNNDEKLAERIEFMHAKVGTSLILEQYVDGRELYVGVMGNTRLQVLPVWELEIQAVALRSPKIATRRVKWNVKFQKRRGVKIGPARNLPPEGGETPSENDQARLSAVAAQRLRARGFPPRYRGRPTFSRPTPMPTSVTARSSPKPPKLLASTTNRCSIAFSPSGSGGASSGRRGVAAGDHDVRFWSKADIRRISLHVRFVPRTEVADHPTGSVHRVLRCDPAHDGTLTSAGHVGSEGVRTRHAVLSRQFFRSSKIGQQAGHRQICPAETVSSEVVATVCELAIKPVELLVQLLTALCCCTWPNVVDAHHHPP